MRRQVWVFPKEAVDVGALTAEHVPPRSFSGRALVLTCRRCNSNAGARLDAHARKRENARDALTGRTRRPLNVELSAGGYRLRARLTTVDRTFLATIAPRFKPGADEGFRQAISGAAGPDRRILIDFHADQFHPHSARVSFLRTGYLVLFALWGYRYACAHALEIVRRQVNEPTTEHIRTFTLELPGDLPWTDRRILRMIDPLDCWGVQVGRILVLLPTPSDLTFYQRIDEMARDSNGKSFFRADTYTWPEEPFFGIADMEASHS